MTFSTLRNRSRLRRFNPERRAKLRERQEGPHYERVRALPCCVSGQLPPNDAHHVTTRGAGGTWRDLVPLSRRLHRQLDSPGWSQPRFEQHYGIDLRALADALATASDLPAPPAASLWPRLRLISRPMRSAMLRSAPIGRVPKAIAFGPADQVAEWLVEQGWAGEFGRVLDLWSEMVEELARQRAESPQKPCASRTGARL